MPFPGQDVAEDILRHLGTEYALDPGQSECRFQDLAEDHFHAGEGRLKPLQGTGFLQQGCQHDRITQHNLGITDFPEGISQGFSEPLWERITEKP